MMPKTFGRKFNRLLTVYRDFGLREICARLLRRAITSFGGNDARNAEWLQKKACADLAFDSKYGTSTGGVQELFDLTIHGDNSRHGVSHIASDPDFFVRLIGQLDIRYDGYSFIDLGSGKGRVLLLAASFPFQHIIGVEFAAELHSAAQQNLEAAAARGHDTSRTVLTLGDVAVYSFPIEPLIVYLFNPFSAKIVRCVAENALRSWQDAPRCIQILYANPVHLSEFVERGWHLADAIQGCARLVPHARHERLLSQRHCHGGDFPKSEVTS